jgi:hypothetical protein
MLYTSSGYAQPGSSVAGQLFFSVCDLKVKPDEYNWSYSGNDLYKIRCFRVDGDTITGEEQIIGGKLLTVRIFSKTPPEGTLNYKLIIAHENDSMIVDFKDLVYPYIDYKIDCLPFEKGRFLARDVTGRNTKITRNEVRRLQLVKSKE